MSKASDTSATASTTDCPHGDTHCPGPDADAWDWSAAAPCFRCYTTAQCPSGNDWCAERGNAHPDDHTCWDCLLRRALTTADVAT